MEPRQRIADNPYAPPQADLTPPRPAGGPDVLHEPGAVRAGRGWGWLADGWALYKVHPWAWTGAFLVSILINVVLDWVPVVGTLLALLIAPLLNGGFAIGAHTQYGGGRFAVKYLFAGFERKPGELLLVGLIYLGFTAAALVVAGLIVSAIYASWEWLAVFTVLSGDNQPLDHAQLERLTPLFAPFLLWALLCVTLGAFAYMSVAFAPALVVLNDVPVLRALTLSLRGCLRNILPFLVYFLSAMALLVASVFTLGLGLLVLLPVLVIAGYIAYRDIYYR